MGRELINELSWSVSRDNLFRSCRRAYYYNYYGAWGGWDRNAPEMARRIYQLKNMQSLAMWGGGIVHGVIAETLRRHALKQAPITAGEMQARARQKMREGWLESVNREWLSMPKKTNLFELYYGNGKTLPREQTEAVKDRVNDCLRAFAESSMLSEMLAASYLSWRPVDQLDSFFLDDCLKVWCAIDFAFTDGAGHLRIIDWKTGSEREDAMRVQLACYVLYAIEKWHSPLAGIQVCGVFLRENARVSHYPVNEASLFEAKDYILTSAAEMRKSLADVEANIAHEADFPTCTNPRTCANCNFREVCPAGAAAMA